MQEWLTRIQSADETTKRRWLIILSAAAMIIVIAIWIVVVTGAIRPQPTLSADTTTEEPAAPSLFSRFADGAASFYRSMSGRIAGLAQVLGSSNIYRITSH